MITALRSVVSLALAVSSLAQTAPHPSLPGSTVPDGLGVNIHSTDPMDGEMELLAAAGFRWVRMDLGWEGIERERGVYDFSAFDRLPGHLQKHGIKALFILDYSNRLYEKDRSVQTGEGRQAFARWAAAAAIHQAAPGVAVIGPATSGFDFPFMEACFQHGVLNEWGAGSGLGSGA